MATNNVRALSNADFIGSCNEMLSNKCQCKRPASWRVLDAEGEDSPYFLCNRCKVLAEIGVTTTPILEETVAPAEVVLPFPTPKTAEEIQADLDLLNGEKKNGTDEPESTTQTTS